MSVEKWNESGRVWEEDHGLLDEEQVAKCERADVAEPLRSPVPTRMISNGEYMPVPQTEKQKRVEARIEELADEASKKLGISRRQFLASSGGMAAALARHERGLRTVLQRQPDRAVRTGGVRAGRPAEGPVCLRRSIALRPRQQALAGRVARHCPRAVVGADASSRIPSIRAGSTMSWAKPGVSGTRRSSVCRLIPATLTSRSSSRTCIWTARSRSDC